MPFREFPAPRVAENRYGYRQPMPEGSWLVGDDFGYPVRVHNGFAVFTTAKQAAWCAEMMNGAFEQGKDAARAEIRTALGLSDEQ